MTPEPPRHPQLAVSASIFRDGRVLLVRRARSPGKGFYSLPGGRVEYGETLETALAREIAEETSMTVSIAGLAGWREVVPGPSHAGHYVILSFAARWTRGEPALNDELDDAVWVAPAAVGDFKVTEGLPGIVATAYALIGT
ncbi:NUDIX hydrolase [Rhodopseudomonas sp.]|uniref:NUDIX hydrolase n=1 Tax=Rhodopseudomonas sp. TaxID=1078 RepID=UPI003B3AAC8C